MIALICSVQAEAEHLLRAMVVTRHSAFGSKQVIEGRFGGRQVLLCISGMGKVHAATLLLTRFEPEALLNFGIGGAYPSSGAKIGNVAIAKEEIAGDEGVLTLNGFKDAKYIGIPLLKTSTSVIYSSYPAPELLVKRALQSLMSYQRPGENAIHVGTFVTLSTCTGTTVRARELEDRHHGLCENMEGAAVAQVAELHGIPWLEVRGISNLVEDRDLDKWDVPRAVQAAQQAVYHIVEGWDS
jgi:futalosine hydrolase